MESVSWISRLRRAASGDIAERRQQAVDKAQGALDKAEREHAERAAAIQSEVEALEKKSKPKTPAGIRRRSDWKLRCGERGVRPLGIASMDLDAVAIELISCLRMAPSRSLICFGTGESFAALPHHSLEQEEPMAAAKKTTVRGRKQDRARVAGGQDYEVKYELKKTGRSAPAVRSRRSATRASVWRSASAGESK